MTEVDDPPPDSGILGPSTPPMQLTVTIAFGASLFDGRYGLARQAPAADRDAELRQRRPRPTRSRGDVLVQVCAGHRDTVVHTVRELMRAVAGRSRRWTHRRLPERPARPDARTAARATCSPSATAPPTRTSRTRRLMDRLIWMQPGAGEPAWATGGTYQVVRTIRMHVEFWDRVGMSEQQNMIGRDRVSGAPIGGTGEFQDPATPRPRGRRIPLYAHIRLANPRTPATADQRILRRGYNYHRGIDEAGNLDQGLVFVAFNQDIERQFATVQKRLAEEPMVDYITPVGGGYFFAPAGRPRRATGSASRLLRITLRTGRADSSSNPWFQSMAFSWAFYLRSK